MSGAYPVGLVGEVHYQDAIRGCRTGDPIRICHQPDNPYDEDALVALTARGATIGYVARESWLHECVLVEGHTTVARIMEIKRGGDGALNIVLAVEAGAKGKIEVAPYAPEPVASGCAASLIVLLLPLAGFASLLT